MWTSKTRWLICQLPVVVQCWYFTRFIQLGRAAIHFASHNLAIIQCLVEYGAEVNLQDKVYLSIWTVSINFCLFLPVQLCLCLLFTARIYTYHECFKFWLCKCGWISDRKRSWRELFRLGENPWGGEVVLILIVGIVVMFTIFIVFVFITSIKIMKHDALHFAL